MSPIFSRADKSSRKKGAVVGLFGTSILLAMVVALLPYMLTTTMTMMMIYSLNVQLSMSSCSVNW
jgi:hypothetical protein